MEQRYKRMMRTRGQVPATADEVMRRRTLLAPVSSAQVDSRTLHPDQARQNETSNISPIPERNSGSSFSALSNIDAIDPSAIPLTDVLTHAPANVAPSRPPLPHMPLSNTSTLYPPGQTPPLMLDHDGQKPLLTSSPRSSLDTRGEGGMASPP
ncbi:hypothetical protein BJ165DRAFT_1500958 [Panaeolus papilionaceus]|nr:hypothetical protein BJ165DRAFT_1500958 [Panaeolus papilionaceus]